MFSETLTFLTMKYSITLRKPLSLPLFLFVRKKKKEVYPVTFHFHAFKATELNYNIHNKKFLTVFEAF